MTKAVTSRIDVLVRLGEADAVDIDRCGGLTPAVASELRRSGVLWTLLPEELGGDGRDVITAFDQIEEVSRANGSLGWVAMVGMVNTAFVGALVDDAAADRMFRSGDRAVTCGMLAPRGKAEESPDGFTLTGKYSFGSGIEIVNWVASGAHVTRDGAVVLRADGKPDHRVYVLPKDRVVTDDQWDVVGLRGTGSVDYSIRDQSVERGYSFSMVAPDVRRGRKLFNMGITSVASGGHASVAVGLARRALDEIAIVAMKKSRPGSSVLAGQQLFRHDFAFHDAAVRSARAYLREVTSDAQDTCERDEPLLEEQLARMSQACTYVHHVCAQAVNFAYTSGGSVSLQYSSALAMCMRDMAAATQHKYVDPNTLVDAAPSLMDAVVAGRG